MNTYSNYYVSGTTRDGYPEGIHAASKYSASVQDPQILRNVSFLPFVTKLSLL